VTAVTRSVLLPYTAAEMFALVNDVARYREFLPFCIGSELIEQTEDEVVGRIAFARLGLSHALTTRNRLYHPERIELGFVDGPFERFKGAWEFLALGAAACKVSLSVDFQIQASYLQFVAGSALNQAASTAIEAFSKRAVQLYGSR